jgi:hypothetical protein
MVKGLLERRPLIRQLKNGSDGTGAEAMSKMTSGNSAANLYSYLLPYSSAFIDTFPFFDRKRPHAKEAS